MKLLDVAFASPITVGLKLVANAHSRAKHLPRGIYRRESFFLVPLLTKENFNAHPKRVWSRQ